MPRALVDFGKGAPRTHVHKILLLAGINNDSGFLYSHLSVGCFALSSLTSCATIYYRYINDSLTTIGLTFSHFSAHTHTHTQFPALYAGDYDFDRLIAILSSSRSRS